MNCKEIYLKIMLTYTNNHGKVNSVAKIHQELATKNLKIIVDNKLAIVLY